MNCGAKENDVERMLKIKLELIKCRNDKATEKFYWLEVFENVTFSMKKLKFLKILKNKTKMLMFCEVLLYESSEREPG